VVLYIQNKRTGHTKTKQSHNERSKTTWNSSLISGITFKLFAEASADNT
jgi:hypothetical protein